MLNKVVLPAKIDENVKTTKDFKSLQPSMPRKITIEYTTGKFIRAIVDIIRCALNKKYYVYCLCLKSNYWIIQLMTIVSHGTTAVLLSKSICNLLLGIKNLRAVQKEIPCNTNFVINICLN